MHGLWASIPRLTHLTVEGNIAVAGSWRHSSPVGHNEDLWSGFVENSVCKSSDTVDLFIVATRVRLPPSADCSVIYLTRVAHLTWHSSLYYFFEVNLKFVWVLQMLSKFFWWILWKLQLARSSSGRSDPMGFRHGWLHGVDI